MTDTSPIILKFKRSGRAYTRAMEVAMRMDINIEAYLLKCIEEGHKLHEALMVDGLEHPTSPLCTSELHADNTVQSTANSDLRSPLKINPASTPCDEANKDAIAMPFQPMLNLPASYGWPDGTVHSRPHPSRKPFYPKRAKAKLISREEAMLIRTQFSKLIQHTGDQKRPNEE